MSDEQEIATVREAVGVFGRPETLQSAIDELLSSGFDRAELSLLATEHVVEVKLGHQYEKVSDLEDVPLVSRTAYVSTEAIGGAEGAVIGALMYVGATAAAGAVVVSGGTLAAGIAAAAMAGGVGALIGTILAKWIGDHHANYLQEQVDHEVYYCGCERGVSKMKGALFKFSDLIREATSMSTQYLPRTKPRSNLRAESI